MRWGFLKLFLIFFFFQNSLQADTIKIQVDGSNTELEDESTHERRKKELKNLQNLIEINKILDSFLESIPSLGDITALPSRGKLNHISQSILSFSSLSANLPDHAIVEVFLPKNRCETGFLRWGDPVKGFRKCLILGRGESFFGNLEDFNKAKKANPKTYKDWIVGELPESLNKNDVDEDEQLGKNPTYTHCMYRPETQFNGATITYRKNSTIGSYSLDTGEKIHPGKEKWGKQGDQFLLPIRMNKIADPRNENYDKEGKLTQRDNFWFHSHKNKFLNSPLEGLSTWGCVRMPPSCMIEMQRWVSEANEKELKPQANVIQSDEVVDNFLKE
jgi:hypothetical protein